MRIITCFLVFLLVIPFADAQEIFMTRNGIALFTSDAPLEMIKASSDQVQGAVDLVNKTFAFTIDNTSFKGFNSPLQQEHFYENYLEVRTYPVSSFKGKIIEEVSMEKGTEQVVRAKGTLEIHGVAQERIIRGTLKVLDDKVIIHADFTVSLEDHNIKIPRIVNQKIAEVIDVSVSAELNRKPND